MLPGVKALLEGWRKEYNQVLLQFHCGIANLLFKSPCQQPCGLDRFGGWHKRGRVNDSGLSIQRLKEREGQSCEPLHQHRASELHRMQDL